MASGKLSRFQTAGKNWNINGIVDSDGCLKVDSMTDVNVALLMDIREELRRLNAVFACRNFQEVPTILRRISNHTAKPRKVKR